MIKFFRKIRYDLIKKNKTGKYFKYALGEIVLVVIGILIALQINNWNEARKYRQQETQYLKRLLAENQLDITTFSNNIFALEKGKESIERLCETLKTSNSDSILILTANDYFKYGSIYPVFSSSTSTFDDLSSTGNLQIITNIKLRDSLVNHYAKHKRVTEWINVATNWALPLDAPFTYENDIMKFEPSTAFLFPEQDKKVLAEELRANKMQYISNAAAHHWINSDAINQLQILIKDTNQLIDMIEENLNIDDL